MSTQIKTEAPVSPNGVASKKAPMPPDEKFWKRYSPHHEAPLSGVTSLVLHIMIPCLIAIYFFIFSKYLQEANKPIPLGVVAIGEPNAGGGGNPDGVAGGADKEAVPPETQLNNTPEPPAPVPTEPLKVPPQEQTLPKNVRIILATLNSQNGGRQP